MLLEADEKNILKAADIIKKGGIVIYPTDTVYGLGCDPFNINSILRIMSVKKRGKKPMPILSCDIESTRKIAHLNDLSKSLISKFWPGPLTLVFSRKDELPNLITCGQKSVGVRMPDNEIALRLIKLCGGLLLGTSANKSNEKVTVTAQEANRQIGRKVDIVLDGGITRYKKESTIVSVLNDRFEILRAGALEKEKLSNFIKSLQKSNTKSDWRI